MAALTIGPTERAELEANLRSSSPDAKPEDLIELDIEFHRRLCVLGGNRRMYEAWLRLVPEKQPAP